MTDEKEDLEREAFEAWVTRAWQEDSARKEPDGSYYHPETEMQFSAWFAAKSHAEKSKWISVEDRMPEIGAMVLLCGKYENEVIIAYCATGYFDGITYREHWGADINGTAEVTHWQTLPEPPEQGGKK